VALWANAETKKNPVAFATGLLDISLTMSYFHTGIRTIIGAESFHCPVRDGKEWDQLAMVIRLKRVASPGAPRRSCEHRGAGRASQFKSQIYVYV
jgi:hypothetical protein